LAIWVRSSIGEYSRLGAVDPADESSFPDADTVPSSSAAIGIGLADGVSARVTGGIELLAVGADGVGARAGGATCLFGCVDTSLSPVLGAAVRVCRTNLHNAWVAIAKHISEVCAGRVPGGGVACTATIWVLGANLIDTGIATHLRVEGRACGTDRVRAGRTRTAVFFARRAGFAAIASAVAAETRAAILGATIAAFATAFAVSAAADLAELIGDGDAVFTPTVRATGVFLGADLIDARVATHHQRIANGADVVYADWASARTRRTARARR
jgi:hypothetical protein